ncbi:hypothetical protein QAD02_019896 [Eretmocerus hayati]|uniref:Uncharacterized protein n=1 Tax=Eretmocerus hayati TaxID=131215 RepID=A0ACC2PLE4_9HYME|nr:hypothetical protein QAD02_019896 [Eretmocerus hayati]
MDNLLESRNSQRVDDPPSSKETLEDIDEKKTKDTKKRRIAVSKTQLGKKRKLYRDLKRKLGDILPAVFTKDVERGDYIFNLFCDIIRMNNLIDSCTDFSGVDFLITEKRIKRTLSNFFSIRKITMAEENIAINDRYLALDLSPYKDQFEEISLIGTGGQGKVFKARHYLDKAEYAIKKIYLKARKILKIEKSLEEVKILARLLHPNVINYKQAWIEPVVGCDDNLREELMTSSSSESESNYLSRIEHDFQFFRVISNKTSEMAHEEFGKEDSQQSSENKVEQVVILYIQMGLADRNLRQWMDDRVGDSPTQVIKEIVVQALRGLDYIHRMNVVHHDINPKNIFISKKLDELSIQLGDFGLACFPMRISHSQEFGTACYIAPEQTNRECNSKSDLYSLGIVLFELLYPMQSDMERSMEIEGLKRGHVPEQIRQIHPEWVQILTSLVRQNPSERPSARELLDKFENDKDLQIAKLQSEKERLEDEIAMYRMAVNRKLG